MADAAVGFLLENLKQLLLYHGHLIADAEDQVELLGNYLGRFKAFLKDSSKIRNKRERVRDMVKQIRDVAYEAEDTIDTFVAKAVASKVGRFKKIFNAPTTINIAKEVETILNKMKHIEETYKIEFGTLPTEEGEADPAKEERKVPLVREDNVVGLEDETEKIIGYLTEETQELDVISIIGMPGLGKTTLAGKIFRDSTVQFEFPTRIWVYVSQEYRIKDIYLAILSHFTRLSSEDMKRMTTEDLAKSLRGYLETGKYLIVMDDVWTVDAWNDLKGAFPRSNKRGKILITSRHEVVAKQANVKRDPHRLRFLTREESITLLTLEVFGMRECPANFQRHVILITDQCDGLPLAIVVIGGILLRKLHSTDWWEKVSVSVGRFLSEDIERSMGKIISLSFNKLPYHLRACFLYLGMFPEDFEIPVRKLIHLWIAEGFIQKTQGVNLEETAEEYLDDLINRNLVMVGVMTPNGKVKTCRLHDMLREFCITEAGKEEENFFQEIKKSNGIFETTGVQPSGPQAPGLHLEKCRRLCIHSQVVSFLTSRPNGQRVRSFLCFNKEEITLQPENISCIPTAFKLLRVLDIKSIKFTRFPSDLTGLVHLRYIAMSSNFKVLPSAISKLWNLQTLIVDTSERALEIKADIWKMIQLMCLKTNATTILPKAEKGNHGEKLQTLSSVSPQSCTNEVFTTARNIKKLGIRGDLSLLLDTKNGTTPFDSVAKLINLENLKLVNDVFPLPPSEGPLPSLPRGMKFPPNLRRLTLADTYLDWDHISVLAMLENLVVLKLKDNAFKGKLWEPADGGFRKLEVLHIGRTDLAYWRADATHFPNLNCLMLRNCEKLGEVPIGLADVSSLQIMDLHRTTQSAAKSARKIQELKKEKRGESSTKSTIFKLTIYPHDL